ncbi:MAG: sensor histidine kinase [Gemmatimonadetes bacterium]|nr:MAG: sensor histidine kinase [Gemmatimonadota bacterium]
MPRKRLSWVLFPSYGIISLAALLLISHLVFHEIHQFYLDQAQVHLETKIQLIKPPIARALADAQPDSVIESLCRSFTGSTGARLSVIFPSGKILGFDGDIEHRISRDAPEVRAAFDGRTTRLLRDSVVFDEQMIFVGTPIRHQGQTVAVLRAAEPLSPILSFQHRLRWHIFGWGVILLALLSGVMSLWVSRRIRHALTALQHHADQFSQRREGKFPLSSIVEVAELGIALNKMAHKTNKYINKLIQKGIEEEAVLSSMVEGVIAVDTEERILLINPAAGKLLNIEPDQMQGRRLQEAIRKANLHQFVQNVLESGHPIEEDITLYGESAANDIFLQIHGSILQNAGKEQLGVILVFNDVTRLRRLETAQKDFVANVSHELRTPITSIKGFAETLIAGALERPDKAARFVNIIARQANQLNAIVDDLLALSRIERQLEAPNELEFNKISIQTIIEHAIQDCELKAIERQITIEVHFPVCPDVQVNPHLIEQALVNLIDNAIKYSPVGGTVTITTEFTEAAVCVHVQDQGSGIPQEHLPRLFERFYRVDKARSRESGGTGLGLSIVRHVLRVHGGEVYVKSSVNRGSTFTISLPVQPAYRLVSHRSQDGWVSAGLA